MKPCFLIVNADDFGLTEGTNQAIVRAHQHGIVTSTSLLANGLAFEQAVTLAKQTPTLDIGLHLTLTEGPPVAPADKVPALVDAAGNLPLSNQPFARALIRGRLPTRQIEIEFEAQAAKLVDAGIQPSHVDGHKYIHLLPGVTEIAAQIARRFAIPVMRVPHRLGDTWSRIGRLPGLAVMALLGTLAYPVARYHQLRTADRMIGFVDTGHLDHAALYRLLRQPRPGLTELLCHPADRSPLLETLLGRGYRWIAGYDFEAETGAVSDPDVRAQIGARGWQLTTFAEMSKH